jgi:pyruvate-formate lyase-activating enzyme
MTCAEFQAALPFIIDSGGTAEHRAHLESCPVCRDLVADLKYIAEVAKLLVPMEDPPERVWESIQRGLEQEELPARPPGSKGRLLGFSR